MCWWEIGDEVEKEFGGREEKSLEKSVGAGSVSQVLAFLNPLLWSRVW